MRLSKNIPMGCFRLFSSGILAMLRPGVVWAHTNSGMHSGGLSAGFSHPIGGLDHILAMVAVGMWGAVLGRPAIWVLPVVFPLIMAVGAAAGIFGLPLSYVEIGIAVSVIVLGLNIAFKFKPHIFLSVLTVGIFGVFHGYAHGLELPENSNAIGYSIGFVTATGLLHVTGILIGTIRKFAFGERVLQGGGMAIACAGIYLLTKLL